MNKNKDLPAMPLMPMQDKFGQMIVLTGFTKHEAVALEVFKLLSKTIDLDHNEDVNFIVKQAYQIAEIFVDHYDKMQEDQKNILMPV